MVRCSRMRAVIEFLGGRPVIPGCRSDVSKVFIIKAKHSAIAKFDPKPMRPAKTHGTAIGNGGFLEESAYPIAVSGRNSVNDHRLKVCDDQTMAFWNVILSVRDG